MKTYNVNIKQGLEFVIYFFFVLQKISRAMMLSWFECEMSRQAHVFIQSPVSGCLGEVLDTLKGRIPLEEVDHYGIGHKGHYSDQNLGRAAVTNCFRCHSSPTITDCQPV